MACCNGHLVLYLHYRANDIGSWRYQKLHHFQACSQCPIGIWWSLLVARTPQHGVCINSHLEVVKLLTSSGAKGLLAWLHCTSSPCNYAQTLYYHLLLSSWLKLVALLFLFRPSSPVNSRRVVRQLSQYSSCLKFITLPVTPIFFLLLWLIFSVSQK